MIPSSIPITFLHLRWWNLLYAGEIHFFLAASAASAADTSDTSWGTCGAQGQCTSVCRGPADLSHDIPGACENRTGKCGKIHYKWSFRWNMIELNIGFPAMFDDQRVTLVVCPVPSKCCMHCRETSMAKGFFSWGVEEKMGSNNINVFGLKRGILFSYGHQRNMESNHQKTGTPFPEKHDKA